MPGVFVWGRMDNGIPALDLDASDAYTELLPKGDLFVRISREMGLQMGLT